MLRKSLGIWSLLLLIQSAYAYTCPPGQHAIECTGVTCCTCIAGECCPGDDTYYKCPIGTFSNVSGPSSCITCPIGMTTTAIASTSCVCAAGYYLTGSTCSPCAAGQYNPNKQGTCSNCLAGTSSSSGATGCTNCLPGTIAATAGSTCTNCLAGTWSGSGATACTNCLAGTSSPAGASSCTSCVAGTKAATAGATCTNCLAGTWSAAGATSCTNCVAGSISAAGASSCTPCPAGQKADTAGTTCTNCLAGTWSASGSTSCTSCAAGSISSDGAASCTPCLAGQMADAAGTTCTNCLAGTSSSAGATSCTPCSAGTIAATAGSTCSNCLAGTWSAAGASSCTNCLAGTSSPAGASSCTSCSAGTISPTDGSLCSNCAAGTWSAAGATSCTTCLAGTTSGVGASSCTNCSAGTSSTAGSACTNCLAGTWSSAGSTCTSCLAGTISSDGASTCTNCPAGSTSVAGASTCTTCSAGSWSAAGDPACTSCLAGTYSSSGASGCTNCLAGSFSSAGASVCSTCLAGTWSAAVAASCTNCLAGSWSSSGASGCTSCLSGTWSAASSSSCTNCLAGTSSSAGASSCTPCAAGTMSTAGSLCTNCLSGTWSAAGASTCTNCLAGTWSADASSSCTNCTAGMTSVAGASSCTNCLGGTWSAAGDSSCTSCLAGTFSAAGASSCTTCSAGTWSVARSASCTNCLAGTQSAAGASSCTNCLAGTYSAAGSATCSSCLAGSWASTGAASCTSCLAGTWSAAGAASCSTCSAGTWSSAGAASCSNCLAGTWSASGSSSCTNCLAGTTSSDGASSCNNCVAGTWAAAGSTCSNCSAGTWSSAGASSCTNCAAGTISTAGASSCTNCLAGTYSTAGVATCTSCLAGTWSSSGAPSCTTCLAGTWSAAGATTCTSCSAGTLSASGASVCTNCLAGYTSSAGATSCTTCLAGTYSAAGAPSCTNCSSGTWSATVATTCTNCLAGSWSSSGASSCTSCLSGTWSAAGASSCAPCLAGTTSTPGASSCTNCLAGTFSLSGASTCSNCLSGTWSAAGASACISCPQGTWSGPSAASCTNCPVDTYNPNTGSTSSSACIACDPGTANPAGASVATCTVCQPGQYPSEGVCANCSVGSYNTVAKSTTCNPSPAGNCVTTTGSSTYTPCAAGTYISTTGCSSLSSCLTCTAGAYCGSGTVTPTPCPAGTANANTGGTSLSACVCCSAGSTSVAGSTACTQCVAGKYSASCDTSCTNCPAGSYSTSAGTVTCTVSPVGTYIDRTGATSYINCPAGTYNPNTNSISSSACIPCPAGNYSASAASASCTPCSTGYFTSTTGQTVCQPCPVRTFQSLTGQSSCIPCPVGSYNAATAQTTCPLCISGQMQNATGQISCYVCPKGTYQPQSGQASCLNCNPGSFQNFVGQAKCLTCLPGTYSSTSQSTACQTCPKGYCQGLQNQATCIACPAGSYQDTSGQTSCKFCSPGTYQYIIGQTFCNNCSVGTVNPMWGGSKSWYCHQCTQNSYQYLAGQANCINCSKSFCGPCQFTDRTACDKLMGVCWVDYKNYTIQNPLNTSDCLKAIAPICYKIWTTTDQKDPQCLDYVPIFDLTSMKTKVKILSANLTLDGLYIYVNFDKPVWRNDFTDCSTVFSQDTLNWLPDGKTCKWFNSTQLQVDFVYISGVPSSLKINAKSFYYDYAYSQESADVISVPVTKPPPPKMTVVIAGLTLLSECDNLELLANLASATLYPLVFAWNISFITVGKSITPKALTAANNVFLTYSTFGDLKPISIASTYYRSGSSINVTLLAKAYPRGTEIASKTVIVNIVADIPKIKFSSKSQAVTELPGNSKSVLALQIANKRCTRTSRRLLQSDSSGGLIPIGINFDVFSGTSLDVMTKGISEKKLEDIINKMYDKYHILSVDKSQGFQFGKYYKIMATVTSLETGQKNNDTYIFVFAKPSITSVIDPIGSIVSISSNVILNGGNSSFSESKGEMISYKWACLSCTTLTKSNTCACPFITRSKASLAKLTLESSTLVNLCRYIFSLTISSVGTGKARTDSTQINFITFKAPIRPVTGVIIQGNNNKVKDIYFTFRLNFPGPDSLLQYNWTLVEIQSFDPNSTVFYSEKNAFLAKFLKNLGVDGYDPGDSQDIPIPDAIKPTYLTPTTKRFLGADKMTLQPQFKYTFGVVVTYPDYPSFVYVQFTAPKLPRNRLISISPLTGVGFSTVFSLVYLLPLITDIDNAKYQIYRKDCPSNKKSQAKSLTQVMGQSNLFTATLAPGDPKCKYQVEIILRSIEFGDFIEGSVIVTVTQPATPASKVISKQLAGLVANKDTLTVDQTITTLSSLSSVNQTEKSAETTKSVGTMIDLVSTVDSPKGGALTLCDPTDKPKVLNTTTNILSSMVTNQAATIDLSIAGNVSGKATNYLDIAKKVDGGTSIIPSIVSSLSGVADIGKTNEANHSFFNSHQQAVGNMTQMKINETQPGSPPFSVSSPSLEMVVQKNYTAAFDAPQNATSDKGSQLSMPGNLQNQIQGEIAKTIGQSNNTLTVGTSMSTLGYNPFTNTKKSSVINASSISNISTGLASPTVIASVYNDLSKGKLADAVDDKEQDTDIIQVALTPSEVQKNSTEKPTGNNIQISSLPPGEKAYYTFPTSAQNNSTEDNNTLMMPLFYNVATKTWTNDGCQIVSSFFTSQLNVSCAHIGKPVIKNGKVQVADTAISIIVDVLKDFLTVLQAGNYAALYSFGSFLTAPLTNYAVLAGVLVFFGLIALITLRLNKEDKIVLYYERIRTLYSRYGIKPKQKEGLLIEAFSFLSKLKLDGAKATFRNLQRAAKAKEEEKKETINNVNKAQVTEDIRKKKDEFMSNGFNKLSWMEEKELVDLYYFYHENTYLFSDDELEVIMFDAIEENEVLKRLTQQRLEDIILENPSFCNILKSEQPLVNAVAQPDLKTLRPIKTLILASLILGQLFTTGYFFDAKDTSSISDSGKEFFGTAAIIATCCSLMMIPLKVVILFFLGGKQLNNHVTKEELEKFDKNQKFYQTIGVCLLCALAGVCLWGIMMFTMTFTTEALLKWIVTFVGGMFINNVVIFNLKLFFSIVIALFLLKLAKCKFMITIASSCAGQIVDILLRLFSQLIKQYD